MKKHVKKTAVFLAAALLCEAVMPVSALEENVKKQLEAVKSLADLDLDSAAAVHGSSAGWRSGEGHFAEHPGADGRRKPEYGSCGSPA